MTTNNFYYAYTLLDQLYGIDIPEDQFEEVGLIAWSQIGNKRCRRYHQKLCLNNCETSVELPCNCDILEAVTTNFEDFQHTTAISDINSAALEVESYIEYRKAFKNSLYVQGKFIPYERVGNTLYLNKPYGTIHIWYKGVELDDNGLPEINDKEARAIAAYCAYVMKFKEGLKTNNGNIINMAEMLKQQWLKACDQARVPEEISQNEFDEILDAKNTWNRKIQNISYKIGI